MPIMNVKSVSRSVFQRATAVSLSLALSLTAFSLQSSATTLLYKSFNDLMTEADGVVSGHVASVNSQYNADREIYTFVTLDQLEVLSGSYQDATLTIRLKGGKIDKDISHVIGSPEFAEGERVVLFVSGNGKYMVPLVGWTQGVFRIEQDAATSVDVVKDADGNRVVGVQNGQVQRDPVVQSEATIVKQTSGFSATQNQRDGSAGATDSSSSGSATAAAQPQTNAFKSAPTLSAAAFRNLVRNSATLRQSKVELSSVQVLDFTVPNAHMDASLNGKSSAGAAIQQAPVAPQGKSAPSVKDQQ